MEDIMTSVITLVLSLVIGGAITWALTIFGYLMVAHAILEEARSFIWAAIIFIIDVAWTAFWLITMIYSIIDLAINSTGVSV